MQASQFEMTTSSRRSLVFSAPPPVPFAGRVALSSRRFLSLAFNVPPSSYQPVRATTLRVVQVRGDGRCLYRAIAKGLASSEGRRLSENLERADADALRSMAWKSICVDRVKEFASKQVIEGSLTLYCRQMRAPTFYAGEAEMLALADILKIPIKVYLDLGGELKNIVTYGEKYGKRKDRTAKDTAVRVLYANGNHYDALIPR